MTVPRGLSLDRVALVAIELGDLAQNVVFIGGAIAPLLHTDPPFPKARPTSDVDGVIATTTYAQFEKIERQLELQGFRQQPGAKTHAHRWKSPGGVLFDLVPAGHHLGGTGNVWDSKAIETASSITLHGGISIKHVSAPAFLAQKWAAYHDRGEKDPLASEDLEDILALVASRPTIVEEVAASEDDLREYVGEQVRNFLNNSYREDLLAAHLNNAQDPQFTVDVVRERLRNLM